MLVSHVSNSIKHKDGRKTGKKTCIPCHCFGKCLADFICLSQSPSRGGHVLTMIRVRSTGDDFRHIMSLIAGSDSNTPAKILKVPNVNFNRAPRVDPVKIASPAFWSARLQQTGPRNPSSLLMQVPSWQGLSDYWSGICLIARMTRVS